MRRALFSLMIGFSVLPAGAEAQTRILIDCASGPLNTSNVFLFGLHPRQVNSIGRKCGFAG
jgi:hypothetical protein